MKNRVRELRLAHGLTQQELGRKVGVSRQTINAVENGRFDPSVHLAFRLARVFQLPIEEVFLFDVDPDPQEGTQQGP
ncbi:helix-turn-helix transcriptional regulator [Carboxydochorda subterranea]|uniref:Helix-turn-helix transcriptional regulator n=1 Tax=Carboxydichorda subterranea TaxID=3109565 RepID=A0ABZ1C0Z4_9FIRM|nr:helix-turn-helix transcriptional regulator [Limnochorda sp. L945t]WRP18774.1 helix-turn-helix transcriptional regulator [Limnochorda sp. L945t]